MFNVYILYSPVLDSFYKGQTEDIEDRMYRHNSGTNISTKPGIPWILLWSCPKSSRSEAVILESKLKNLSKEKTIRFMCKYYDYVVSTKAEEIIHQLTSKFH